MNFKEFILHVHDDKKITDKRKIASLLRENYYIEFKDMSYERVSRIIKNTLDAQRKREKQASLSGNSDAVDKMGTVVYKEDGTTEFTRIIQLRDSSNITPEEVLRAHGLDEAYWKVVSYKNNFWNQQKKGGALITLYQSKVVVKPYNELELSTSFIQEFFENYNPVELDYTHGPNYGEGDLCAIVPIVDLHYNLLSTQYVTNNEYNCSIAEQRLMSVVNDVIQEIKDLGVKKIILPIGNDLFNANGINGTTFRGTPQTNQRHIQEAYETLFNVVVNQITRLQEIAPVEVIYIPSNHDKEITFYFMHGLNINFKNNPNVTVENRPFPNKYVKFGNSLFVFSHDMKIDNVSTVVFDEAKNLLDNVLYVEVFLAHYHQEGTKNLRNITIRRLPTISGESEWSVDHNYNSNKLNQTFIAEEYKGLRYTIYTRV